MNWLINEAKNADYTTNRVILENPEVKKELDAILFEKFYPAITNKLKETGLRYSPTTKKESFIESSSQPDGLGRGLSFILFDHVNYPILTGKIEVTEKGYMFKRQFLLGLPKETPSKYLFRILDDPGFRGMLPSMEIYESIMHPEWNVYYHISIEAGTGFHFGQFSLYNTAIELIEETIENSLEMYELSMLNPFSSMNEVEEFLKVAYKSFESG